MVGLSIDDLEVVVSEQNGSDPVTAACGTGSAPASKVEAAGAVPRGAGLAALSDDFTDPSWLARWNRFEPLATSSARFESLTVEPAGSGVLRAVPTVSVWYAAERGAALLKDVVGDVAVTARVRALGRAADHPTGEWSLVGLLLRAPAEDFAPENWVYLTTGSDSMGGPTLDSKSTVDSASGYKLVPAHLDWVDLRVVRAGAYVVHLYRLDDGPWRLLRVIGRPDLPDKLQAGINVLTGFGGSKPDLNAEVDYVHFSAVTVSQGLATALANGTETEAQLVAELGQ
jgi:hypothetical protein